MDCKGARECEAILSRTHDLRIPRAISLACTCMLKKLTMFLSMLLPWPARRSLLEKQFGYSIHPTSRIGFAWICPRRLIMEENSRIGHLTICKNIDLLHLGAHSIIGQLNWITGFPSGSSRHLHTNRTQSPSLF